MKCALIADTILLKRKGDYFGVTLTYDFLAKRYLKYFDQLVVISREDEDKCNLVHNGGYLKTNGHRVAVCPIPEYRNIPDVLLKKNEIRGKMERVLEDCDAAIIRLPNVLGLMACRICLEKHIPYIIEMLACPWDGYMSHTNKIGKIIAPIMYMLNRKEIKRSKNTVYVTSSFLQKRYPTMGNAYSCSDVELGENEELLIDKKIKRYRNIKSIDYSFGTVANIQMKYKGHVYMLKALKKLKKKGYHSKYYLIGNGSDNRLRKICEKYNLQDDVVFVGSLDHNAVMKALDEIDVYVQPSLQEGLPRALIEAMSRGCVCIGSNCGGIPELLDRECIFPKRNAKKLYEIIVSMDKEKIIHYSTSNFERSKDYSERKLSEKRDRIYMTLRDIAQQGGEHE